MATKKKSIRKPAALAAVRLVKLDDAGNALPRDAIAWTQVHDLETGLIWPAETLGDRVNYKKAIQLAAACRIGGHSDWRMPSIRELLTLVDYTRFSPAINTEFFGETKSSAYWSTNPVASAPQDYAWGVNFYNGNSHLTFQYYAAFVRAVRSASASQ